MDAPVVASEASQLSNKEDREIWRCVPDWDHRYEFSNHGQLRYANGGGKLKPLFVGPDGCLGFLMTKGISSYLKGLHELYQETFPELAKEWNDKLNAD